MLSTDTYSRLKQFLTKIEPNLEILNKVLERLEQSDPSIKKFEVGYSRLVDRYSGHLILNSGDDYQIHFYYQGNKFTKLELINQTYPDEFEVFEL